MRIVVDTNVLISAALKAKSLPGMALHLVGQRGVFIKSKATEKEFLKVIVRPHLARLIPESTRDWLMKTLAAAEMVEIKELITVCRDPDDDKFLELAVNGRADIIISGDKDLLALDSFRGIAIIPPAVFVEAITRKP